MTRKDPTVIGSMTHQVLALKRLNVPALRAKYLSLFGEETRTHNKSWLLKRLAWRLQALAEGDLSDRARQRAAELACDADLRLTPPRLAKKRPAAGARTPNSQDGSTLADAGHNPLRPA